MTHPEDALAPQVWAGVDLTAWSNSWGADEDLTRQLLTNALRKAFVADGVLLARPICGGRRADAASFEAERAGIARGEESFGQFLARYRLVPDLRGLSPEDGLLSPGESR